MLAKQFAIWHRLLPPFLFSAFLRFSPFSIFFRARCNLQFVCFACFGITGSSLGLRPNESRLLMCSRISSLDYTCNLRPALASSIWIPLVGALLCCLLMFSFGLHFMISHCQYPHPVAPPVVSCLPECKQKLGIRNKVDTDSSL